MSTQVVLVQCSSGHRNWIEPEALPMVAAYYCAMCGKQILAPLSGKDAGLSEAEMKEQGARCGCRGSDDYCVCQNSPDATTVAARRSSSDEAEVVTWPPGHPDSRYYRTSRGDVFPYPHGMTGREWDERIGRPSYEHAKELPED